MSSDGCLGQLWQVFAKSSFRFRVGCVVKVLSVGCLKAESLNQLGD